MTSFRFNFDLTEDRKDLENEENITHHQIQYKEAFEILQYDLPDTDVRNVDHIRLCNGSIDLHHINANYIENLITRHKKCVSDDLQQAIASNSDLIPSVYEGGLKVWECSLDLIEYLSETSFDFMGKDVLELGCGAGLPAIYALCKGASSASFQDYNLKDICHFFVGDWYNMQGVLDKKLNKKFDVILTSETIYSLEAQENLYELIKASLIKGGIAYVAAKTFYFGVGGGMRAFENLLIEDKHFSYEISKRITEGVNREIMLLRH